MPEPFNACVALLDHWVETGQGDRIAIRSRGRSWTYSEVLSEVERIAGGLRARGVRPEERVLLVLVDSVPFAAAFLATLRIGAVPVLVNPLLPIRDISVIAADSRARLALVSDERVDAAATATLLATSEVDVVLSTDNWDDAWPAGDPTPYPTWDESPGFWLCTSGSTGRPKLAMHRHIDLVLSAQTYAHEVLGITEADVFWSVGPAFHAYGLGNSIAFPFSVGATAVLEPTRPPTPALVAEMMARERPTLFFTIPTVTAALNASTLPDDTFASVRLAVSAAEPLPADTYRRFLERFGVQILDGIGSTELNHIYCSNRPGARARPGTSGQPVRGYDVRLLDDEEREVGDDTPGHLWVAGPTLATGYWCRNDQNRQAFVGRYLRTGDMYERSADGYFTYLGRSDDMLRVGGEWVSPAEVEAVLIELDDVLEAAVIGERDGEGIQRPVAFIVPAPGATTDVGVLESHCRERLAGFKRPRRFDFVDTLPKTTTGKIQRFKLRDEEQR